MATNKYVDLSYHVDITLNQAGVGALALRSYTALLVNDNLLNDELNSFVNSDDVLNFYGESSIEYNFASVYFGQDISPSKLLIADRGYNSATTLTECLNNILARRQDFIAVCSTTYDSQDILDIATWVGLNDRFSVAISQDENNFDNLATTDIASVLKDNKDRVALIADKVVTKQELGLDFSNATFEANYIITGKVSGADITPIPFDTDLATTLGNLIIELSDPVKYPTIDSAILNVDIVEITSIENVKNTLTLWKNSNLVLQLTETIPKTTITPAIFGDDLARADAGIIGYIFGRGENILSVTAGSEKWKTDGVTLVTASDITTANAETSDNKFFNTYQSTGNGENILQVFSEGRFSSNEYIYLFHGAMYLAELLQSGLALRVFKFNDGNDIEGYSLVQTVIDTIMKAHLGTVINPDTGYTVTMPPTEDFNDTNKTLEGIVVEYYSSDKIHKITLILNQKT